MRRSHSTQRGFQSGKRMIQIAAATADIKHGVARLRVRREQAHGLAMSRHFRNLARHRRAYNSRTWRCAPRC